MIELKEYNGNKLASSKQIYEYLAISRVFSDWIKLSINNAMLIIEKDFYTYKYKSTGGRPFTDYLLTERAAIRIVLQSRMPKSIELETIIVDAFKKRQNLEYITPKEAALAYEYVNFFKYIDNQKQAFNMHKDSFVINSPISKYVFADFAKYRANIVGWDKTKVDAAIQDYLTTHAGHNFTRLMKLSMSDKISIIDVNEAIRISVLDLLFSKGTEPELANKFANMVKNVSKEMEILALRKNETNLFQQKEIINLKSIQ